MAGWLDPQNPRQDWLEPESQTAFDVTEEQEEPANWTGQEEGPGRGEGLGLEDGLGQEDGPGQKKGSARGAIPPASRRESFPTSQAERSPVPAHPAGMPAAGHPQVASSACQGHPAPGQHAQTLPADQDPLAPDEASDGIVHIILRCPRCNTPNPKITSTQGPTRYHKCQKCGLRFKSVWV